MVLAPQRATMDHSPSSNPFMSKPTFVAQLLARDPRRLVRFPDYPVDTALAELTELKGQLDAAQKQLQAPPPAAAAPSAPSTEGLGGPISALATQIWRTKIKMLDPVSGEPREESKRVYRHVESSLEALTQMGVTLNDWLGQPYDPGLPVKVLTFQPTDEVTRDTIVEAVKPTVIWRDQLLQLGEVVVGIPPTKADH
jgi:hypothetical protein